MGFVGHGCWGLRSEKILSRGSMARGGKAWMPPFEALGGLGFGARGVCKRHEG